MKNNFSKYFLNLILPLVLLMIGACSAILTSMLMDFLGLLKFSFIPVILFLVVGFLMFELILFGIKLLFGNVFVFIKSEKIYIEKNIKSNLVIDKPLEEKMVKKEKQRLTRIMNIKDD